LLVKDYVPLAQQTQPHRYKIRSPNAMKENDLFLLTIT